MKKQEPIRLSPDHHRILLDHTRPRHDRLLINDVVYRSRVDKQLPADCTANLLDQLNQLTITGLKIVNTDVYHYAENYLTDDQRKIYSKSYVKKTSDVGYDTLRDIAREFAAEYNLLETNIGCRPIQPHIPSINKKSNTDGTILNG